MSHLAFQVSKWKSKKKKHKKQNKTKKWGFTASIVHRKISHWTHQSGWHGRKCECAEMSMRPFPFSPHTAHLMRRLALHHRTKLYTPRATIMSLKALQSLSCSQFLHLLPAWFTVSRRVLPSPLVQPTTSSLTTLLYHLWWQDNTCCRGLPVMYIGTGKATGSFQKKKKKKSDFD